VTGTNGNRRMRRRAGDAYGSQFALSSSRACSAVRPAGVCRERT